MSVLRRIFPPYRMKWLVERAKTRSRSVISQEDLNVPRSVLEVSFGVGPDLLQENGIGNVLNDALEVSFLRKS